MREVCVAAVQMYCNRDRKENLDIAEKFVREAAAKGAQIILLPELFETWYFCQEKNYQSYHLACSIEENPAVQRFLHIAAELSVVLPISFYERKGNTTYNTIAIIDADGTLLGIYRKTHIPDDHFYQEKFYFTPGNTGFQVWETKYGKIGVGICWDQWFPEAARCMVLQGAEMLFYPTAIGSEPVLSFDSMPQWQRCMQGHSAANIVPVIAANRIGTEEVKPCLENNHQVSALNFYGSSFITDWTGEIKECADRNTEHIIMYKLDLEAAEEMRRSWGVFRDRRPEKYQMIVQ
ncbi:MAG TPA: N-carbamoylputrescine amidase [Lachnospiraceae bacterium]|nr:N-carbamoylputrescine amidase [Lachnospiraceae bacterium]